MSERSFHYHAYLLRFWRDGDQAETAWRASLEDPHTGETFRFATVQQLYHFLDDMTAASPGEFYTGKNEGLAG